MRTVHPSIIIGSYVWDEAWLPRDEFQIRTAALNRAMDEHGWKAVLIYGDARDSAALAYFSNFIPRVRWGMALLPRQGEPRLLCSMSSRDMPGMRLMTWIPDVHSGWEWERNFDSWLAGIAGAETVEFGTIGFDLMQPTLTEQLAKSLGNRVRLVAADTLLPADRALRPRELSLLREGTEITKDAAAALLDAWRAGEGAEAAALEGERHARAKAAQDVRTLVSLDGGQSLAPLSGAFAAKTGALLAYIAVQTMGFWSEIFVTDAAKAPAMLKRAEAGLAALLAAARPDARAAALHAAAVEPLGSRALHPVLSGSVGRRIGLGLDEGGTLTKDGDAVLRAGQVYGFHVGGWDEAEGAAIVSAVAEITAAGARVLCSSADARQRGRQR